MQSKGVFMSIEAIDQVSKNNIVISADFRESEIYQDKLTDQLISHINSKNILTEPSQQYETKLTKEKNAIQRKWNFISFLILFSLISIGLFINQLHYVNSLNVITTSYYNSHAKKEKKDKKRPWDFDLLKDTVVLNDSFLPKYQESSLEKYKTIITKEGIDDISLYTIKGKGLFFIIMYALTFFVTLFLGLRNSSKTTILVWTFILGSLGGDVFDFFMIGMVSLYSPIIFYFVIKHLISNKVTQETEVLSNKEQDLFKLKKKEIALTYKESNLSVLKTETDNLFTNNLLRCRNDVIDQYNMLIEKNEQFIGWINEAKYAYQESMYKRLYTAEETCLQYMNFMKKQINNYYILHKDFSEKYSLYTGGTIPSYGEEFASTLNVEGDLLHFVNTYLEKDTQYQLMKSQLNMEVRQAEQFELMQEEMQEQTRLAQAKLKVEEEKLASQLKTEKDLSSKLKSSLDAQNKQSQEINKLSTTVKDLDRELDHLKRK